MVSLSRPGTCGTVAAALLLLVVGFCLPSSAGLAAQDIPGRMDPAAMTPAQRDALGQSILDEVINEYGLEPRMDRRLALDSIVRRLVNVASAPGLNVRSAIVANREFNAFAAPGQVLVVFSGLLDVTERIAAREFPRNPAAAALRARAFAAAVVSHELGHIIAGHTADLDRRAAAALARAGSSSSDGGLSDLLKLDQRALVEKHQSRVKEYEADRLGALLSLRAGWTIQDAMDLWRAIDTDSSFGGSSRETLSYASDHPANVQREAALEQYRGKLKLDQTLLDDAVLLIRSGQSLDAASAMLDTVVADFPTLGVARHARAALRMQQWMQMTEPADLQVRAAVGIESERFYTNIRGGDAPDAARRRAALDEAWTAYRENAASGDADVLSGLAVLDAYRGAPALARARADSAVARAGRRRATVLNNRGVVRFLAGNLRGAKADFDAASALEDTPGASEAVFNAARTQLALGDTSGAARDLRRVARAEGDSPWGAEARRLGGLAHETASATLEGQAPPVAGVRLGMGRVTARTLLALPTESADDALRIWRAPAKGMAVAFSGEDRVELIVVDQHFVGSVLGIEIGMSERDALAKTGMPTRSTGTTHVFYRDGWALRFDVEGGVVSAFGIVAVTR